MDSGQVRVQELERQVMAFIKFGYYKDKIGDGRITADVLAKGVYVVGGMLLVAAILVTFGF